MLKKIDENLEQVILVVLLILMTLIMGIQITSRYAFGNSLSWSEELTRFLFVWSAFIGVSYTTKKGTSIRITNLVDALPERTQFLMNIVSSIILLLFFIALTVYGFQVVVSTMESKQLSAAMGIPMWIVNLSVFVSGVLSSIRTIQNIMGLVNNRNKSVQN